MSERAEDSAERLSVPRPTRRRTQHLQQLLDEGYLTLHTASYSLGGIPAGQLRDARASVRQSTIRTESHARLKAVATWVFRRNGWYPLSYEISYPGDHRIADVACSSKGVYAEVGMTEDVSRIYHALNIDPDICGSTLRNVRWRHPPDSALGSAVDRVVYIPFPASNADERSWDLEYVSVYMFKRGDREPLVVNRDNWGWVE